MAVGTAIKNRAGSNYRTNSNRPFTSDLSGQDFWTLLKAGYQPLSLVMGTCVYHVAHLGVMQSLKQLGQNVEMANYTQALYDARELALSRMQAEAEREGATGIVGAQVREGSYGWEPFVIEYFAVGTAVKPIEGAPPVPAPTMTLPLVG